MKRHLGIVLTTIICLLSIGRVTTIYTKGNSDWTENIQSPAEFFGHEIGADRRLVAYDELVNYYTHLQDQSDRVRVRDVGRTTEGRPMLLVEIADAPTIANIEQHKEKQQKIADPRLIENEEEKKRLIQESKVVVWINCQLHSTECGASQMAMELAYDLAAGQTPDIREILDHVIVVLVPCANPDGQQKITEWYEKTLGQPWEGSSLPYLYHTYAGHDNNRDWYMLNLQETRLLTRVLYKEWFPTIYWDLHQTRKNSFRFFLPPHHDPQNPNTHPLINRELLMIGGAMSTELTRRGKKGTIHSAKYDNFWTGHSRSTPFKHNIVGILTEAASANLASPIHLEKEDLVGNWRGMPTYDITVNFPDPWPGGWWRLRDIVEYEKIAAMGLLKLAARYHDLFQSNYIQMGLDAIERGKSEPPFAWLIPADQKDPRRAYEMLERIQATAVDIHMAEEDFTADGKIYPKGTYILYCAQPYRPYIMDMMEEQAYPHRPMFYGGPDDPPSDPHQTYVSGWTFPLQMGVHRVAVLQAFSCRSKRLDQIPFPQGKIRGPKEVNYYLIPAGQNDDYRLMNRLYKANIPFRIYHGGKMWFLPEGAPVPAGSILISPPGKKTQELAKLLKGLSTDMIGIENPGVEIEKALHTAIKPRTALYQPWTRNKDEGWTRYVLEQFEFPCTTLHNEDVKSGHLNNRFDCIILPSEESKAILNGLEAGSSFPEYTGGIEEEGVRALKAFVRFGGTLICIDASTNFAIDQFDIPVRNLLNGDQDYRDAHQRIHADTFYCPGSILSMSIDPGHPLGYGMPVEYSGFFRRSQAFEIKESSDTEAITAVSHFAETKLLESGWIRGEEIIAGKPAIIEAAYGKGWIDLIGIRVQHRSQTHGTFRILFNAIQRSTLNAAEN